MPQFYFTYGLSPQFPFRDGWTEVEAPDDFTAAAMFRAVHPDRPGDKDVLNCAFLYEEEEFKSTEMYKDPNFGGRCHERITFDGYRENPSAVHRELLDIEHRYIPVPSGGPYADKD